MPKGVVKCGNCEEPTIFGKTFGDYDKNDDGIITEGEVLITLQQLSTSDNGGDQALAAIASNALADAARKTVPTDTLNEPEFAEAATSVHDYLII